MNRLLICLAAVAFTGLFLGCTDSTESDPPTEVRLELEFEKIPLVGGDTVTSVRLLDVTVGDESFGNLSVGDQTDYIEFEEGGPYTLNIASAVVTIMVCGTFCAEGDINIPTIDAIDVNIDEKEKNTITLNSNVLDVGDWVAGTRIKVFNKFPIFDDAASKAQESMDFFGLTVGDVKFGVIIAQNETDYEFTDTFGPRVPVTVDSIRAKGMACFYTDCTPSVITFTPTDTAYISLDRHVKNSLTIDPAFVRQVNWLPTGF